MEALNLRSELKEGRAKLYVKKIERDFAQKSHGVSRSNLYARAVAQFLETHSTEHITKQLNEAYSSQSAEINSTISSLQFSSLEQEEW